MNARCTECRVINGSGGIECQVRGRPSAIMATRGVSDRCVEDQKIQWQVKNE